MGHGVTQHAIDRFGPGRRGGRDEDPDPVEFISQRPGQRHCSHTFANRDGMNPNQRLYGNFAVINSEPLGPALKIGLILAIAQIQAQ